MIYENLSDFLTFSLTIFCFLPSILALISFAIAFYNFYYNYKTRKICEKILNKISGDR